MSSSSTATATTAKETTQELADREGLTTVHPYDDPRIMAGAGTSTRELLEDAGPLDLVVIPVGGGGQLSGGAVAAAGASVPPRVIGVEPAAVGAWRASLAGGPPCRGRSDDRRWPAIAGSRQLDFAVVKELVEDVVSVTDDEVLSAMAYLFERQKIVVEPSGSSALAAVLSGRVDVRGLRIGVVLSGGNIAIDRFVSLLADAR